MRLTSFVKLSRSGIILSSEASQFSKGLEELLGFRIVLLVRIVD